MTATVRRIHTDHGSHIHPALDQTWDDLTKLRWHLAVVLHDADLPPDAATVNPGTLTVDGQPFPTYTLNHPGSVAVVGDFHRAWAVINGIAYGLQLANLDRR